MSGHVIAAVPYTILRSALRLLISQGSVNQKPFVHHVRERLSEAKPDFTPPLELFPVGSSEASVVLIDYLARIRCIFSCKLVEEALPHIVSAKAIWTSGSSLEASLVKAGGDIIQAIQALKESDLHATPERETFLRALLSSMQNCRTYCSASGLEYLFNRPERQARDVLIYMYPHLESEFTVPTASDLIQVDVATHEQNTGQVESFQLGHFRLPRLFNGFWQLSSPAWGSGTAKEQTRSLVELVEAGLTAADMADHYGDAELIYGDFRNRLPQAVKSKVFCATKWCVFKPCSFTPEYVLHMVKERSRRVGGVVELLQFHWHDYNNKDYLDILAELVRITKSHPELVSAIGLCNFDSEHATEVCEHLLKTVGEVGVVSNQVQFSLFDSRPRKKMADVCDKYSIKLLVYGTFCGGMLSSKWMAKPVPEIYSAEVGLTPSQRKYLDIILTWSSWDDFQLLLVTLNDIAQNHGVSLTNVATRWVLQQRGVGAVIVGTRLGMSNRWKENLKTFGWTLSKEEMASIDAVALGKDGEKSDGMLEKLGDCGNEYRAMH
ncbi:aldo-keto reductase [Grosmannia clavigera kw1407]|uniref:Aldo-keto reductase n=1 Tax=Grosmannia clavigera (strain kw1407 / UAMH 11150) TaxID=655863 RepID=F0X9Q7_GROCL|nr:aldo-keto reductase [Grosmannia clavigera kw1407]EFX05645.1 aldo-keto reductase [Grosmannia clavigera kw1407]